MNKKLPTQNPVRKVSKKTASIKRFHFIGAITVFSLCVLLIPLFFAVYIIKPNNIKGQETVRENIIGTGKVVGAASDRVLVKFKETVTKSKKQEVLNRHSLKEKEHIGNTGISIVTFPDKANPKSVVDELKNKEKEVILFAEVDELIQPTLLVNDPYLSNAWHLPKIGATDAWDKAKATNVVVGVCDTGFEASHPDLSPVLRSELGFNTVDNTTDWSPIVSHGTMVAGAVAATVNNNIGVAGVAWDAKIIPVRISNLSDGSAYVSDAAECIAYAVDNGARVINLSYRMAHSAAIDQAAQYAESKGAVTTVAAGNDGIDPQWPDYPGFLAVGSVSSSDQRSGFSNYGAYIDIAAPGDNIITTYTGNTYAYASGTSLASPVAAGVVALALGANPSLTAAQVKDMLLRNADDLGVLGDDSVYGAGRVNARRVIEEITGVTVPDTTPPTAPLNLTATPMASSTCCTIQLSWRGSTDNVGVLRYDIYVNGNKFTAINSLSNDANVTYTYNNTSLAANTSYSFFIKAVDAAGNNSEASNTATATTQGPQLTVSDIQMTSATNKKGVTSITTKVRVTDTGSKPVGQATVQATLTSPTGTSVPLSGTTTTRGNSAGTVSFTHPAGEKGTYTFTIRDVVKNGYTYQPSVTTKTVTVN